VTCVERFVRGTFSDVERLVTRDILCRGTFCAVGRFVPWDV
jgi:hypothetical protein